MKKIRLAFVTLFVGLFAPIGSAFASPFVQHEIPGTTLARTNSSVVKTSRDEARAQPKLEALTKKDDTAVLAETAATEARTRKQRERHIYKEANREWRIENK